MTHISDIVQPWRDAIQAISDQASTTLTDFQDSERRFRYAGDELIKNNGVGTFQGQGAQAFQQIFVLNDGQSMLINAKFNDFCMASNLLVSQIDALTSQFELENCPRYYQVEGLAQLGDYQYHEQFWYDIGWGSIPVYDVDEVIPTLMNSFLTYVDLNTLLDSVNMSSTIYVATNWGCDQIFSEIEKQYQDWLSNVNHPDPQKLAESADAFRRLIQNATDNMNSVLMDWASALYQLVQTYTQEVEAAARINQPTVGDFIYESNMGSYSNQNVLIWPLPNGGYMIMIKGGDPAADLQAIKNYFGTTTGIKATIMGYGDEGVKTAQQLITDGSLPVSLENAILIGNQDAFNELQPGDARLNYVEYMLPTQEQSQKLGGLTKEQWTLAIVTGLVALALGSPELIGAAGAEEVAAGGAEATSVAKVFQEQFGDLSKEKLVEYAAALGYNVTNPDQAAADLVNYVKANNTGTTIAGMDANGKPIFIPTYQYVQQKLALGNTVPNPGVQPTAAEGGVGPFRVTYTINDSPTLSSSPALNTQSVLDPTQYDFGNTGYTGTNVVTVPQGPVLPPSTGG